MVGRDYFPGGGGALSPCMDGEKIYPKISFQREGQPKNIKPKDKNISEKRWLLYRNYGLIPIVERLRNESEDKTKTQMTQSFSQYSENETKILPQNVLNQFNRVSSSCLGSHFVISQVCRI